MPNQENFSYEDTSPQDVPEFQLVCGSNLSGVSDMHPALGQRVFTIVCYLLIFLVGLIGNSLVLLVSIRAKHYRRSTVHAYILHLAVADMLFLLFCVPVHTIVYVFDAYWPLGDFGCRLVHFVQYLNMQASASFLVAMSLDRYLAISDPMSNRRRRANAQAVAASLWLISGLISLPWFLTYQQETAGGEKICSYKIIDERLKLTLFIGRALLGYVIPLLLIGYFSGSMLYRLWIFRRPESSTQTLRTKRKVTILVVTLVASFLACWLPFHFVDLASVLFPCLLLGQPPDADSISMYLSISQCCLILGYVSSCVNPIIYNFLSENFRRGFRQVLSRLCRRRVRNSQQVALPMIHLGEARHQRLTNTLRTHQPPTGNNSMKRSSKDRSGSSSGTKRNNNFVGFQRVNCSTVGSTQAGSSQTPTPSHGLAAHRPLPFCRRKPIMADFADRYSVQASLASRARLDSRDALSEASVTVSGTSRPVDEFTNSGWTPSRQYQFSEQSGAARACRGSRSVTPSRAGSATGRPGAGRCSRPIRARAGTVRAAEDAVPGLRDQGGGHRDGAFAALDLGAQQAARRSGRVLVLVGRFGGVARSVAAAAPGSVGAKTRASPQGEVLMYRCRDTSGLALDGGGQLVMKKLQQASPAENLGVTVEEAGTAGVQVLAGEALGPVVTHTTVRSALGSRSGPRLMTMPAKTLRRARRSDRPEASCSNWSRTRRCTESANDCSVGVAAGAWQGEAERNHRISVAIDNALHNESRRPAWRFLSIHKMKSDPVRPELEEQKEHEEQEEEAESNGLYAASWLEMSQTRRQPVRQGGCRSGSGVQESSHSQPRSLLLGLLFRMTIGSKLAAVNSAGHFKHGTMRGAGLANQDVGYLALAQLVQLRHGRLHVGVYCCSEVEPIWKELTIEPAATDSAIQCDRNPAASPVPSHVAGPVLIGGPGLLLLLPPLPLEIAAAGSAVLRLALHPSAKTAATAASETAAAAAAKSSDSAAAAAPAPLGTAVVAERPIVEAAAAATAATSAEAAAAAESGGAVDSAADSSGAITRGAAAAKTTNGGGAGAAPIAAAETAAPSGVGGAPTAAPAAAAAPATAAATAAEWRCADAPTVVESAGGAAIKRGGANSGRAAAPSMRVMLHLALLALLLDFVGHWPGQADLKQPLAKAFVAIQSFHCLQRVLALFEVHKRVVFHALHFLQRAVRAERFAYLMMSQV
uniref:G_PROTEIN_RECEP_F1_2 domain-containing protein n=2 Tax=Macrostomum lignano TaxID=282301 RepID=A0A1I8ISU3_9PLAT